MTTPPPVELEQALAHHGDTLYRLALLLAGNEPQAAQLLQATVRKLAAAPPTADDTLVALLAALVQQPVPQRSRSRVLRELGLRGRSHTVGSQLYAAIDTLPLPERRVLGLHLLLNYELPLVVQISASSEQQIRNDLATATRLLATASGAPLPDTAPTELCPLVRNMLAQQPDRLVSEPQLRGHLALCEACRAFEQAREAIIRQAEMTLRNTLREHRLPPALAADLIDTAQPRAASKNVLARLLAGGRLSLALLPILVLLLIAALVLPGFWRSTAAPLASLAGATAEPRGLVQQALSSVGKPPPGQGLWHGRWETLWQFPGGGYAPINADAWHDPQNPARHRLEITHSAGGAPYELQIGDGRQRIWYALHPSYYGSLYGSQGITINNPRLVQRALDTDTQGRAALARWQTGVWDTGAAYLRQAYAATDLRTMGRQRDNERLVQIVSFTGFSPLGLPDSGLQDEDRTVTVLLALDAADGRLRSATELVGPPGGAQTSRVTWRLASEEWISNPAQIRDSLDPQLAWNGIGRFPPQTEGFAADLALLLFDQQDSAALELLFIRYRSAPLLPGTPPPGVDRALLHWYKASAPDGPDNLPASLTYLGPGRQLTMSWGGAEQPALEQQQVGSWLVRLQPSKPQRYRLTLRPNPSGASGQSNAVGNVTNNLAWSQITLEASGFTRSELLAFVKGLRPLDTATLQSHQKLFLQQQAPQAQLARQALMAALVHRSAPDSGELHQQVERTFQRHNPLRPTLLDPYHQPRYNGRPEHLVTEHWIKVLANGSYTSFSIQSNESSVYQKNYADSSTHWQYDLPSGTLSLWQPQEFEPTVPWMHQGYWELLDLMAHPGDSLALTTLADGTQLITRSEQAQASVRYSNLLQNGEGAQEALPYIFDLQPLYVVTELLLEPVAGGSEPTQMRVSVRPDPAANKGDALVLVEAWDLVSQEVAAIEQEPLELRNGVAPTEQAVVIQDWSGRTQVSQPPYTITISEARALARSPLLLLPTNSEFRLAQIEAGSGQGGTRGFGDNLLLELAIRGLAQRFIYRDSAEPSPTNNLLLAEGPAKELRQFLRAQHAPWQQSEPRRVVVAGREVDAWLMKKVQSAVVIDHYWLVVEMDGTLLIAEGYGPWFMRRALPVLATLEQ